MRDDRGDKSTNRTSSERNSPSEEILSQSLVFLGQIFPTERNFSAKRHLPTFHRIGFSFGQSKRTARKNDRKKFLLFIVSVAVRSELMFRSILQGSSPSRCFFSRLRTKTTLPYEIDRFNGACVRQAEWPDDSAKIRENLTSNSLERKVSFFVDVSQSRWSNGDRRIERRFGCGFRSKSHTSFRSPLNSVRDAIDSSFFSRFFFRQVSLFTMLKIERRC